MAALTAAAVFATARTLLNDDANTLFTDAVLLPKLVEAQRQLYATLRINAADIVQTTTFTTITAGVATWTISDINEPIMLWEKAVADPVTEFVKMTEYDPLPNDVSAATLRYWQWDGATLNFIAASANRSVKSKYWRVLPIATSASSSLYLINAEYYLAPMTAAIMVGTLGEDEQMTTLAAQAVTTMKSVIDANRGRMAPPDSTRP